MQFLSRSGPPCRARSKRRYPGPGAGLEYSRCFSSCGRKRRVSWIFTLRTCRGSTNAGGPRLPGALKSHTSLRRTRWSSIKSRCSCRTAPGTLGVRVALCLCSVGAAGALDLTLSLLGLGVCVVVFFACGHTPHLPPVSLTCQSSNLKSSLLAL